MSHIIIIPKLSRHSPFKMVWVLFIWINVGRIHGSANRTQTPTSAVKYCSSALIPGIRAAPAWCLTIFRAKKPEEKYLQKKNTQSVVISETKYIQAKIGEIYGAKSNKMFQIFRFERIFSLQCENPREISRQSTNIC